MKGAPSDPAMAGAAESVAFQHAHPLFILAISTAATLVIVSVIVLIRWLLSRGAWSYHPGGAKGFLVDEFARWGVVLIPLLLVGLVLKYYIYAYRPDLNNAGTWGIYAGAMIVIRIVSRQLPFVKAVARHIDAAKAQYKAAKQGKQA